jgi:hypothetical protein
MDEKFFGIDGDLLITEIGLVVAGMAAIIGIWVERDRSKPPRYAIWLSALISLATSVGMFQCFDDHFDQKKVEEDLARVLASLDKIASESDVDLPALNDLIKSEIAAANRANPSVVEKVAQRVADEGGDPATVMAAYLPEGEVQAMQRSGRFAVKPQTAPATPRPEQEAAKGDAEGSGQELAARSGSGEGRSVRKRRTLTFGGGPARMVGGPERAAAPVRALEPVADPAAAPAQNEPASAAVVAPAAVLPAAKAAGVMASDNGRIAGKLAQGGAAPAVTTQPAAAPKPATPGSPGPAPRMGGFKR